MVFRKCCIAQPHPGYNASPRLHNAASPRQHSGDHWVRNSPLSSANNVMICAQTQGTGQPLLGPRAWGKLLFGFLIRKTSRYNSSHLVGIFVNSMSQSLNCGSRGVMSVEHYEESDNTGLEHARTQNSKPKVAAVSEVFVAAHQPWFTVH